MAIIAQWGEKTWEVSYSRFAAIDAGSLGLSYKLKSNANSDTSGTPPTNTTGLEAQTIPFSAVYQAALGTDVRAEIESWGALVGKVNALMIGGKQFGPKNLQLDSVDATEIMLDAKGNFLSAKIAFAFVEYVPSTAKASSKGSSTKQTASSGATTAATTATTSKSKGIELNKVAALSAKPSTAEKAVRKPPKGMSTY